MGQLIPADATFLNRAGLAELTEVLGADRGEVRFVGGIVRDTMLGIDAADVDLATTHQPEDVLHALKRAGIKAVPTGLAHGTITAILPSGPVEVTTLRRDVATDGRHATVAFTDNWREDAARRDFTMNALYADPRTLEVIDYFGGLDDLAARRVRFIGDPLQRVAEDHLRILRFFRFYARFGDSPDADGLAVCTARANDLMALSRERVAAELLKLLVAAHAVRAVGLMIAHGIFRPVLPEIADADRLATLAAREAETRIPPDPIRRLAALLPRDAAVAEDVGARLRLSNHDRRRLIAGTEPVGGEAPRELLYRLGATLAADRLLLSDRPIEQIESLASLTAPIFPIKGGDLVQRGIGRGPDVARLLRTIEDLWIAEDFPDAERTGRIADSAVDQWLISSR
ncbi:polynucleotide adenylyltransferase [Sphingomonas sp. Leaf357]|uniref:CCA tRNA nucleotidyltransferase n=1 Tax=Sphingomonas sp. Leaf357 TaxID=1736350 RepID=UPI0006FD0554|nr:CCA tRNA nucleotidyltransferase [Sphingomonas sp. Leaf357]KQS04431.1 polynucleotide adenylyltransferase [Sphingomonas sp. Leaf357]